VTDNRSILPASVIKHDELVDVTLAIEWLKSAFRRDLVAEG
jgi:hypothetical protein